MLKKHWFYNVFAPKCWKSTGFTLFSLQNVKQTLVLHCFHFKMLKSIGFTVLSLQNVKKALVLLCFRSKMLKKHWFYCVFAQTCWKTIGFTSKEALKPKKVKKHLVLLWIIFERSKNHYKTWGFLKKRVVKPISGYGFGPWISNTRLEMLWGTLTDKLFREIRIFV